MRNKTINVVLTHRKAELRCKDESVLEAINDILKYRQPGWQFTPAAKFHDWDGYQYVMRGNKMGAGLFLAMKDEMERSVAVRFKVLDERRPVPFAEDVIPHPQTRDYQKDCVEKMIKLKGTGGLILNATGTGKTYIAGLYFHALIGSACFVVDELTLMDQARFELARVIGEKIGQIGNSVFDPQRITVATVQTLHKFRYEPKFQKWSRELKTLIIDELHVQLNRRNFQTVTAIKPPLVFGLTATLELKKKRVRLLSYDLAGPLLFEYPLQQGVTDKVLSKGLVVCAEVEKEKKSKKIPFWKHWERHSDYQRDYTELIVENGQRNGFILSLIKEARRRGKYTIALMERVKHLHDLSDLLDEIPHRLVYGKKTLSQRKDAKDEFEAGGVRVLLANKVFKKGVSINRVDVIIDAAAMRNQNDAVQKYGRGVRLCADKSGLIYIDISDSGNRFESAALARRRALKRVGIPVYKIDSSRGAKAIFDLAEKRLKTLI